MASLLPPPPHVGLVRHNDSKGPVKTWATTPPSCWHPDPVPRFSCLIGTVSCTSLCVLTSTRRHPVSFPPPPLPFPPSRLPQPHGAPCFSSSVPGSLCHRPTALAPSPAWLSPLGPRLTGDSMAFRVRFRGHLASETVSDHLSRISTPPPHPQTSYPPPLPLFSSALVTAGWDSSCLSSLPSL